MEENHILLVNEIVTNIIKFCEADVASSCCSSCLHHLLPPPRSNAVTSRLRSYEIYPRPSTRTKRYCSLVQYGLSHYQNRIANS